MNWQGRALGWGWGCLGPAPMKREGEGGRTGEGEPQIAGKLRESLVTLDGHPQSSDCPCGKPGWAGAAPPGLVGLGPCPLRKVCWILDTQELAAVSQTLSCL